LLDFLGALVFVVASEEPLGVGVVSVVVFVGEGLEVGEDSGVVLVVVVVEAVVVVLAVIFPTKTCMLITMGLIHLVALMDLVEVV